MDHFHYRDGVLYAEDCDLRDIAATHGTPCYVYSRATLEHHFRVFDEAFAANRHLVCYAVKANSNLAVLQVLARLGSGFDIVSVGELERVIAAGGDPGKVVFSGVAKTAAEMRRCLAVGIRCFNVESLPELERLNDVARDMGVKAPVAIRVNPDVDAQTHPYIATGLKENKFGIDIARAPMVYDRAATMAGIDIRGVACHIGSQLTQVTPFVDAMGLVIALVRQLQDKGIRVVEIDIGGGLGIPYKDETPPAPKDYAQAIAGVTGNEFEIMLEPGRAIAGNAGILLTTVEFLKDSEHKHFAVVDAGMNDLLRPALYDAWQEIVSVEQKPGTANEYDIVGPVCETGDFLGKKRSLVLAAGDLLAVRSSGAYGYVMSSNYNSRPRVPEILVDADRFYCVRRRESLQDLLHLEQLLPDA